MNCLNKEYKNSIYMKTLLKRTRYVLRDLRLEGINKINSLEEQKEIEKREKTKKKFADNKPTYDAIMDALKSNCSDIIYYSPEEFKPANNESIEGVLISPALGTSIVFT